MSYDAGDLTSSLNLARALLGDTSNDANELLDDDHIDAVIALYTFNGGVAFLATELATRFAQQPSRVGLPSGLSVSWERVQAWLALAKQMREGGVTVGGAFSVAGLRDDGYAQDAAL